MKLCVVVLLMTIGLSWATITGNGRPGCKTEEEMRVKVYRNLWDPTRYWICETVGVPAATGQCDDYHAWMDSEKACIRWEEWGWEDPVLPPSQA